MPYAPVLVFAHTQSAVHSYHIPWFMYASILVILAGYAWLEFRHTKRDHVISLQEATRWSIFYITIAVLYTIPVYLFISHRAGVEYISAWAIEKSLSLDNLFVIGSIFASFQVEEKYTRRMLNYGIAGAIIFRLIFILLGYQLLKEFAWVSVIFGVVLLRSAWHTYKESRKKSKKHEDYSKGTMWHWITKILPIYPQFNSHNLTVKVNGKRLLTMMAAIIVIIELTDIAFAIDSVPAVLAVSPDRFVAYASNIFALLGLRALFFVYQSVENKFWALNWSLTAILTWIGLKLIGAGFGFEVSITISLGVLFVLLALGILISLLWPRQIANGTRQA